MLQIFYLFIYFNEKKILPFVYAVESSATISLIIKQKNLSKKKSHTGSLSFLSVVKIAGTLSLSLPLHNFNILLLLGFLEDVLFF